MFGWINACTEQLVLSKFGVEAWHEIKQKAGCQVNDGDFIRYERYSDESTVALVVAASEVLGLTVPEVLEAFGCFFMEYTRAEGYDTLLSCQGSTLRTWLCNVNALHDHLESSHPKGFVKPVFWCEHDTNDKGTLILHYFSRRGNLLAPVVKGVVKEVARYHFDVTIQLNQLQLQDVDGAKFSSWQVSAVDPEDSWKLDRNVILSDPTPGTLRDGQQCPFSTKSSVKLDTSNVIQNSIEEEKELKLPERPAPEISLSSTAVKEVFPYHIVIGIDFTVLQVGKDLPSLLNEREDRFVGANIKSLLTITQPVYGAWEWDNLNKLKDQTFFMKPVLGVGNRRDLHLKGSTVQISPDPFHVMLILSPDVKNVQELRSLGLTMSDLPLSSFQRDAVFLGEHIHAEVRIADKLEKLSKNLAMERNLSNALLYSVLPKFVAQDLRAGKSVDPNYFEEVSVLFADVVSFTSISSAVEEWEVIEMLNRLFCIVDFLCQRFGVYKIDTIGDAFIGCSGLPSPNPNHAQAVANFAIAMQHCVKEVVNPASPNDEPIQLRIGIHSGPCVSGVVGMSTPKYTVFGDTMNCAARHESTALPGKTQISSVTHEYLDGKRRLPHGNTCGTYLCEHRGNVEMKGKGQLCTYWLSGAAHDHDLVGTEALSELHEQVCSLLATSTFNKRRYFLPTVEEEHEDSISYEVDGSPLGTREDEDTSLQFSFLR